MIIIFQNNVLSTLNEVIKLLLMTSKWTSRFVLTIAIIQWQGNSTLKTRIISRIHFFTKNTFCNFRINISLQKICFHPFFFSGDRVCFWIVPFRRGEGEFLPSDNSLILMLHFGDKCDFRFSRRLNDLDLYLIVCTCVLDQSRNLFCKVNQAWK